MEFKKIQLNGFKSFADKTNFLIEDGLTGIVGPNGCGKSNIVESLRWVMGETSAKSMRGSGMEDDIFSGTSNKPSKNIAEVSRLISQKEEHAKIAKKEVITIWGDYFKEPQITKFPEVHDLVHSIMMSGSKSKQALDRANAEELLEKVNKFAEIFWATKNISTEHKICQYPPGMKVVCPKLEDA